jgi:hypothetical protein
MCCSTSSINIFSAVSFIADFQFYFIVSDTMKGVISILLYLLRLALCPKTWSLLETVPWTAEKYTVLLPDEIFFGQQRILTPFVLWCHLVLRFLCWLFCLSDVSICHWRVLKSPTTTVIDCICVFMYFHICLKKLGAQMLGEYRLIVVISFWCIAHFITMKLPSLSHLRDVSL